MIKENETKEKKSKKILKIIRIILILVIVFCLIYIGFWYMENKKSADMLNELTDSSILESTVLNVPTSDDNVTQITTYVLDFNNLLSINSSTVGWIHVPNTRN